MLWHKRIRVLEEKVAALEVQLAEQQKIKEQLSHLLDTKLHEIQETIIKKLESWLPG